MQQDQRGQQPIQQQKGQQQPIQQQAGQQQQQPIQQQVGYLHPVVQVFTQNGPARSADQFTASALTQMKGLSLAQIVVGIVSILCGILLIFFDGSELWYIGHGIWIGCYFVVVGGIGISTVRRNNSCWIIAAMVLNIISAAAFCSVLLSLASVELAHGGDSAGDAMASILILAALVELVVAIWSAVLCCGTVCACCKPTSQRVQYNDVQYSAAPGMQAQPVVMYANTSGAPGAPGAYGFYPVQHPYATYSAGAALQPVGYMTQPQAPPRCYPAGQSKLFSNPGFTQPSPAAADPVPTKH